MKGNNKQRQVRELRVNRSALNSLIRHQAGTLQKALLEGVTNSMDAGATRIDVTIAGDVVVLKDDGIGFKTLNDIDQFFDDFGFDHSEHARTVGRFGIGRGQLFCFGVNKWRTSEFLMEVDINKNNDFSYELEQGLPAVVGTEVKIELYEKLESYQVHNLCEEVRRMVHYMSVPVYINGDLVNEFPSELDWTEETENAYYKLRKDGRLTVYSQGILVGNIWESGLSIGGCVVTKVGFPLEQNMARNDVIRNSKLWMEIKKKLTKYDAEFLGKAKRSMKLTDGQRGVLISKIGDEGQSQMFAFEKLIVLSNGKAISVSELSKSSVWTKDEENGFKGDRVMQMNAGLSISHKTLDAFGCSSVEAFRKKIAVVAKKHADNKGIRSFETVPYFSGKSDVYSWYDFENVASKVNSVVVFETPDEMNLDFTLNRELLELKHLTPDARAVFLSLRNINFQVGNLVNMDKGASWKNSFERKLGVFKTEKNDGVHAFTDGRSFIQISEDLLIRAAKSFDAYSSLFAVLVHEYAHDSNTESGHSHDIGFYESVERAVRTECYGRLLMSGYKYLVSHLTRESKKKGHHMKVLHEIGVDVSKLDVDVKVVEIVAEKKVPIKKARVVANAPTETEIKTKAPRKSKQKKAELVSG